MLFDTDILIWCLRANAKAAQAIENAAERSISTISYMELLQGARDKKEIKAIRDFLKDTSFTIIPVTENISHRASVYMEEYCLKVQMSLADALIAATATENNIQLYTGNNKHYKQVKELSIKIFRP
ncbi:MAG: type II toxin-antitoxin system VapC family toxin [Planctomycetaceae bacterium]|nr:type II toxin-antitoxin system VapC family toxin [Planctomycetaceae bacterium]